MIGSFNTRAAIESAKQRIVYLEDVANKKGKAAEEYCERERTSRGYGGAVFYSSGMFGDFEARESVRKLKAALAFMESVNSDTISFSDKEAALIFGIPNT